MPTFFSKKKKIRLPQKPNRTNFQPNGLVRDPNFWNIVPLEHEALLLINILRVHIILPKRRILELKIGNRCFGHVPRCRINIPSLPGCPQDIEIEMPSNPKGRISRALSSHFVWLILNYEDVLRKKNWRRACVVPCGVFNRFAHVSLIQEIRPYSWLIHGSWRRKCTLQSSFIYPPTNETFCQFKLWYHLNLNCSQDTMVKILFSLVFLYVQTVNNHY